jgi:hypothetical protein
MFIYFIFSYGIYLKKKKLTAIHSGLKVNTCLNLTEL